MTDTRNIQRPSLSSAGSIRTKDLHVAAVVDDHDRVLGDGHLSSTTHHVPTCPPTATSDGPPARISVRSDRSPRRYVELHDEIAELDARIGSESWRT